MESAAAEEITKVACGDILLMISTSCLEACWLPHLPQARRLLINQPGILIVVDRKK
jgi:hypothetical protein